jgi:iron complex transport system substrate-binding protein
MRIVSLLPSATEIVYALGLDRDLHGVTDECDFPRGARAKRVVVRSRQPGGLGAGEIDAWVRAQAAAGGLYILDDAALAEIAP